MTRTRSFPEAWDGADLAVAVRVSFWSWLDEEDDIGVVVVLRMRRWCCGKRTKTQTTVSLES